MFFFFLLFYLVRQDFLDYLFLELFGKPKFIKHMYITENQKILTE